MKDLLTDYPVTLELRVNWGDMDAYQHVNNTVYLRYFEDARIAYFERIGMEEMKRKTGVGPILASTQCRFRIPLTYPDQVTVGARVSSLETDRFTMEYRVVSHGHQKVAADGRGTIVVYDYEAGAKATAPDSLRAQIIALEGTGLAIE